MCDLRSLEELSEQKTGSDEKEPVNRKRVREAFAYIRRNFKRSGGRGGRGIQFDTYDVDQKVVGLLL